MRKIESLRRRITVLSILAVALAAARVFRPAEVSTQRTEELPALVEGFTSDQAARITLEQAGSLITAGTARKVRRERRATRDGGTAWAVSSAFGYPAGDDKVARLLSEISQARVSSEATRRSEAFEQYVRQLCPGDPPVFDVMLLGLGDDGHTASLFPGTPATAVRDRAVTIGAGKGLERITLTAPVLSAAHQVIVLVSGEGKRQALQRLLDPAEPPERTP